MDFQGMFAIKMSVAEIIVRASAIYWFLFLVFRFILRRDVGAVGIADILLLVLIADGAQNAMAGGYKTVTEGLILVSTILGWNGLLNWLSTKSTLVHRFVTPRPLVLVRNGRILRANLRHEMMTLADLQSQLRLNGVETAAEVKVARLEEDGQISVIKRDSKGDQPGTNKKSSQPM
jgi:uncharacterized membrane protein YcaP (DUF421 family)